MFNPTLFEQKVYDLVTQEVNNAFSVLIAKGAPSQEGFKIQRQMMEALHSVTEETILHISYGLAIRNKYL
jgi:hypothetical protein